MNSHLVTGTITFVIWSSLCTWYYVNYTSHDEGLKEQVIVKPISEITPPETTKPVVDTVESAIEVLPPMNLSRSFECAKNESNLLNPDQLNSLLDSINQVLAGRVVNITVEGFTCDIGTSDYNKQLSEKRADQVREQIAGKIPQAKFEVKGRGEASPLFPNDSEVNRQMNRRVTIFINQN
ncbi:MAG: OmpA family protein [Cyclobacteriaceae bacterium]